MSTSSTPVTPQPTPERFPLGAVVRIKDSGFGKCIVAEHRGALGPKGVNIYRVQFRKKPPGYTEVREDQLELAE